MHLRFISVMSNKMKAKQAKETRLDRIGKSVEKRDEISRQLGDLRLVQGEIAEDLLFR